MGPLDDSISEFHHLISRRLEELEQDKRRHQDAFNDNVAAKDERDAVELEVVEAKAQHSSAVLDVARVKRALEELHKQNASQINETVQPTPEHTALASSLRALRATVALSEEEEVERLALEAQLHRRREGLRGAADAAAARVDKAQRMLTDLDFPGRLSRLQERAGALDAREGELLGQAAALERGLAPLLAEMESRRSALEALDNCSVAPALAALVDAHARLSALLGAQTDGGGAIAERNRAGACDGGGARSAVDGAVGYPVGRPSVEPAALAQRLEASRLKGAALTRRRDEALLRLRAAQAEHASAVAASEALAARLGGAAGM